jgi:hypothetical protein
MAKLTINGVTGEYMPHEVIDLMNVGLITNEEGWRALGMSDLKINITFEHDSIATAERRPFTKEDAKRWARFFSESQEEKGSAEE